MLAMLLPIYIFSFLLVQAPVAEKGIPCDAGMQKGGSPWGAGMQE